MSKEKEACSRCGVLHPREQLMEFDGQLFCPECLREATVVCERCGNRLWESDAICDDHISLCSHCYERYYSSCADCGRIILENDAHYFANDDDEPFCGNCYERRERRNVIRDYYFRPDAIFYGIGPRFFGVELEIDEGGEDNRNAAEILGVANCNGLEHAYAKHDGSLNDGIEIVAHPMSLEYHLQEMPWKSILTKCKALGYTSHKAGTCGLHIHVSRAAFGKSEYEQDACIARILFFVEKFWDELLKFSRRTPRQLDRWAARYGFKDQPMDILNHAKKGTHAGRYTCVNLTNTDTIEFRMFRGTLKQNTFVSTLQLVDRICDVALHLSDTELQSMSWTTFVSGCTQKELIQYLKERRLYINEPVDTEEEV